MSAAGKDNWKVRHQANSGTRGKRIRSLRKVFGVEQGRAASQATASIMWVLHLCSLRYVINIQCKQLKSVFSTITCMACFVMDFNCWLSFMNQCNAVLDNEPKPVPNTCGLLGS